MGEVAVGEGQVVDVGGVFGAEGFFLAVVEAVGMRDGHMQEEKVDGGVCEESVACGNEASIVAGVLANVAAFIGG